VLGTTMIGDAKGRKFWLKDETSPITLGDTAGDPGDYRELTALLPHSSFGTLSVLAMLASAVPRYLRFRGADAWCRRAHFRNGDVQLGGDQRQRDDHGTWEGSRRGQEEYLRSRNDVGAIFDRYWK
jgi:hypothetical protein